jgi:hypothetical protein
MSRGRWAQVHGAPENGAGRECARLRWDGCRDLPRDARRPTWGPTRNGPTPTAHTPPYRDRRPRSTTTRRGVPQPRRNWRNHLRFHVRERLVRPEERSEAAWVLPADRVPGGREPACRPCRPRRPGRPGRSTVSPRWDRRLRRKRLGRGLRAAGRRWCTEPSAPRTGPRTCPGRPRPLRHPPGAPLRRPPRTGQAQRWARLPGRPSRPYPRVRTSDRRSACTPRRFQLGGRRFRPG